MEASTSSTERKGLPWYHQPVEEHLSALLILVMSTIALIGTISRYVFGRGIPYLELFTPELFVWMVFLGAAAAARRGAHLGADIIVRILPQRAQWVVKTVVLLLSLLFYALLVYYGWEGVMQDRRFGFTNALGLPNWWITVAMPIGGVLLILRTLQAFFVPMPPDDTRIFAE